MKFFSFLKDVKNELAKAKWLKKKEIWSQFVIVNVISAIIIAYFLFIDVVIMGVKSIFN